MGDEGRLAGEVALITGSTRGIGRATAARFAAEGASVVVTGRSAAGGTEIQDEIRAAGGKAVYVPTDLAEESQVAAAVQVAVELYGKLTILVNNAAPTELMGPGKLDRPLHEVSDESWDRIMQVSLRALVWTARHAVPRIAEAGGGAVCHLSSAASIRGVAGLDTYTAAKGAINALTRSMAVELAPERIRVNAIISGMVLTSEGAFRLMEHPEIGPATRAMHLTDLGRPEDIASAALFLCSREARFVTGVNLPVDGGATCRMPVPDISAATFDAG